MVPITLLCYLGLSSMVAFRGGKWGSCLRLQVLRAPIGLATKRNFVFQ